MKLKKPIIIFSLLFAILFFSRTWLFQISTNYQTSGNRELINLTDQSLIEEIKNWQSENNSITADKAIRFSLKLTARKLKFSTKHGLSSDPNKLSRVGEGNCVGYSKLFNSVANYIFENTANLENWEANHLIGRISFLGINLHDLTDKSFWSDHDYNRIINLETKEEYFVDPSVFDYFRITYIQ